LVNAPAKTPRANLIKLATPKPFFNPIQRFLLLKIKQKDVFWRKFWRKFQCTNLCVEKWRSLRQKMT
jgi:hypothetical protein